MGQCLCKPPRPKKRQSGDILDQAKLRECLHTRVTALADEICANDNLNNHYIPDFVERRLIQTMLFTVFAVVLRIMLERPPSLDDGDTTDEDRQTAVL